MPAPPDSSNLQQRRQALLARLGALGDLRPGSLVQNYRRCGKSTCFCADKQKPGHGPYWLLTRSVNGKTRSQSIPASQVKQTQAQIAECQRLRRLVAELIDISDELCRSRLGKGTSAVEKSGLYTIVANPPYLGFGINWIHAGDPNQLQESSNHPVKRCVYARVFI